MERSAAKHPAAAYLLTFCLVGGLAETVRAEDGEGDGESDARALLFCSEKRLKDVVQVVFVDPRAVVGD